ncbi:hypothetical protein [Gordonia sp. MP11Mi]|uniref:Uncharacterized protein n=1 Tax=Gordonia sp. MP11Mi TaxID=3022769 RepID=A0AA97GY07_9ACTN
MTSRMNRRDFAQTVGQQVPVGRRAFRRHVQRMRGWAATDPRIDVAYAAYRRGLHGAQPTTAESSGQPEKGASA